MLCRSHFEAGGVVVAAHPRLTMASLLLHLADIDPDAEHVRFRGLSGHRAVLRRESAMTQSGQLRCDRSDFFNGCGRRPLHQDAIWLFRREAGNEAGGGKSGAISTKYILLVHHSPGTKVPPHALSQIMRLLGASACGKFGV
jgi:hypothetical protein